MRRAVSSEELQLLGVPHFRQGDADSLCVYYAMAMLIGALLPEWQPRLLEPPHYVRQGSPIFRALRDLLPKREFEAGIASWFFKGLEMTRACKLLNTVFRAHYGTKTRYFSVEEVRARRGARKHNRNARAFDIWTAEEMCRLLRRHLPVVVCNGGLGEHAVVVIGYGRSGTAERWLYYLDPAQSRVDWRHAGQILHGDAVMIIPSAWRNEFSDHRPDALITRNGETTSEPWSEKLRQKLRKKDE
jgi:hypothetical protein